VNLIVVDLAGRRLGRGASRHRGRDGEKHGDSEEPGGRRIHDCYLLVYLELEFSTRKRIANGGAPVIV
jgi:hypothetical protein